MMEIVTDPAHGVPPAGGSAVTIGAYDGVHLGHQALLAELQIRARSAGLATVVVTFDRHPATVVRPDSAPKLLCDLDQKLELLDAAGVDRTLVITFDEERANETAEEFVSDILVDALHAHLVVVGEDFHFGHGRKGNVALLRDMGSAAGFVVDGVAIVADRDGATEPISSTRIRRLVAEGRVEDAALLLGRLHQVRGPVVVGDGRGATELGFPTANVDVPDAICLPGAGTYAGWYERPDGSQHMAAISVGRRPTFYGESGTLLVEAHLLDFAADLYGEEAKVAFQTRLHDDIAFESAAALVDQITRDVAATRLELGAGA